jgi:signal transduction histidine kinase
MVALGALIGMLFVMLTASMRDQSRMLRRLVQVAWDNEQLVEAVSVERDKARAASDSKTRFFAAASHDLRQPLHALSINTTTLEVMARRQADPAMMELSQSIGRALRQSNSLLDSLLDISQLEANVVNVRRRPVHAAALLQGLRDEFAAAAAQRGLALALQAPADAQVWLDTDPKQLRRVLANLISNALKFTHEGSVTLLLQAPAQAGAPALLAVVDTGPGIPEAEHERVFEDFYQIGNPSRDRSHGLGLGLSIVRRTAALLDVQVRLASCEGHGARFELAVPTCDPPASAEAASSPDGPARAEPAMPAPTNLNLRVLAIDDEVEILESLAVLLPHFGCEMRSATSLAAAQAVLDSGFEPALLIVDHRLRGETSAEVVAALHARLGSLPTVIVTGDTAPEELRRMQQMGAHVMHKPIDGLQLAQVLHGATSTDRSMFPA